ncbi:hypothetical protein NQ317_006814, partial [Molorchus minor]
ILFISGLACVIGRERTFRFFFQRHKARGSLAFFGGIIIVLLGWPVVGMLVETYGFVLLFRQLLSYFREMARLYLSMSRIKLRNTGFQLHLYNMRLCDTLHTEDVNKEETIQHVFCKSR